MKQKRIILIPNEIYYNIDPINLICESHKQGFENIDSELGLCIPEELQDAYDISHYLASRSFCVIMYDKNNEIENTIVYLPIQISAKQVMYIGKLNSLFTRSNLFVNALTKENDLQPYDNQTTDKPIIDVLRDLVNKRWYPKEDTDTKAPRGRH